MKKRILILILLLSITKIFSEEPTFILNKDSILIDGNLNKINFSKDEKLFLKTDKQGIGIKFKKPLILNIILYDSDNNDYECSITDVNLLNYSYKLSNSIQKDYWIPSYYYDLLKSNNIKNDILKYEPYLKNIDYTDEGDPIPWYLYIAVQRFYFGDFYFVSFGSNAYEDVDFFAYLEETSDNKIIYNVQKMYSHYFDYKRQTIYNQPEFLPLYEKQTPFKIIYTIDGDYMNMYIDKVDEKNLFQTLVRTSPEACDQIENFILGKSRDLSKVTTPKRGNNTVSKTSTKTTTPSTNVAVNKTMVAYENLKLRSAEATSSSVITVMSSGTKVKILQLGKPEKIDGIDSNWVKVEVQKGAKDRDGKSIKAGTVGWCYGGYLE